MRQRSIVGITTTLAVCTTILAVAQENNSVRESLESAPYKIVFETYRDKNWDLFQMNADGSQPVNLTNTQDRHEMYPQCSPDGTRICFVSDEMRGERKVRCVYWMRFDGTDRTLVAEGARQPCWSPDGKTIAYLRSKYDEFQILDYATKGIVFYDLKTGQHRDHPNKSIEHLYNPCWSKNGRWIVSTIHAGMGYKHAILAIEIDGDKVVDLKIDGCRPDLSPDGTKIAWGKTDHILAIGDISLDSEPPAVSNIRDVVNEEPEHVYHIDWSPDGQYLSFSHGPGGKFQADGPGTNRGIAELVGVRAPWNVCVIPASGEPGWTPLTDDGSSNKESDFAVPRK